MNKFNDNYQPFLSSTDNDNIFHCSLSSQMDSNSLTELIIQLGALGQPISMFVEHAELLSYVCTEDGNQIPKDKNNRDYYDDLEFYQIFDPIIAKWQLVSHDESSWIYVKECNVYALQYLLNQNMGMNGRFILIGGDLSEKDIQIFNTILNYKDFELALTEHAEFILKQMSFSLWSRMPNIMDFYQFYFISQNAGILKSFEDIFPPYTVMHSFLLK